MRNKTILFSVAVFALSFGHAEEVLASSPFHIFQSSRRAAKTMRIKPADALKGNCLGACKAGLCQADLLPSCVLRKVSGTATEIRDNQEYTSHEGLFFDDLFRRPYAYKRYFEQLGIPTADFEKFVEEAKK